MNLAPRRQDAKAGPVLVSACLLGKGCRFDGGHCRHEGVLCLVQDQVVIPVCPEALGGLARPRPPAEIRGGDGNAVLAGRARVVDRTGRDVTAAFVKGARAALTLARKHGAVKAILKERSPSCGTHEIHDGTFGGRPVAGPGVAAALLAGSGVRVTSEEYLEGWVE